MISPDDGWRYEPPQVPDLDFEPQQVDVPGLDFQDTIKQFDVNRAGTLGTMTVQRGFGNTQIKVMDFQQGTIVASVVTPKEVLVLDIDNHQQRLLLLSNRNSIGERFEVGTFLYGDSVLTEESVFAPFPDLNLSARNVTSANFVGEHELVAVSQSGRVSVWNLETLREECGFDLKAGANVVCGPDPDMIAFADDEKFGIFHVGRQEFLGVAQIPEGMKSPQIAISPSGTRLALAEGDQAVVVDTINGHVIETIPLAEKLLRDLEFATDEFLLVSHGALYSIADRMLLWDYTGADQAESLGNMTLFVSQGPSDKGSVIPATLPDAKAQAARDVAHAQPELFVVRPGDSVQIDVTNVPTQYRKTVQDALTEQVQDRDLTVVEESDVVLIATITGPEQKVYEYGGFGSINGGAGYVISEFVSTLEIRWKDQVAWSKQRTNAPGSVSAEQGKSYQDVLREKTKTPNLRVFEQAGFPTYVRKPSKGPAQSEQALGKSVINSLR
ncbi:MAG: hypothetical protein KDA93_03665 [Planctomycetaceae bacterium]|nr:hypothetical protein [Planctomycetaceae bacterium]